MDSELWTNNDYDVCFADNEGEGSKQAGDGGGRTDYVVFFFFNGEVGNSFFPLAI